ncbi:hypothetical protein DET61_1231, partial [Marinobacter nauticus]
DSPIDGEVIQETLNFVITHDFWVLLVIEKDEQTNPVKIGLLGSVAVLLCPNFCADCVQPLSMRHPG